MPRRLLFALVLAGAAAVTAAGARPPWADDDDGKDTAGLAEFGVSISGFLWPRKDHDFYRVVVPGPGLMRIRVAGLAPNVAAAVKVHDARATWQRWVNGEAGKDLLVPCPIKFGGTYWVELADTKDTNYSTRPYTFELDFQPVTDLHEPNDGDDEASVVTVPATLDGFLFPPGDTDRFRFFLPESGCLQVILTGIEPTAGSRIMVVGEDGLKITGEGSSLEQLRAGGWVVDRKLGYQKLLLNVNRRGIYTLLLQHVRPLVSQLPYRLHLAFFPTSLDTHEPNDSVARAKRIYPGERVQAYILPARDRDFFRVYVRGHGRMVVRHASPRGALGSALNVADPRNEVSLTGGWRHAPPEATEHEVQVPVDGWGDYLVEVGSPDGLRASIDPYELRVYFFNRQKGAPWVPERQGLPRPSQ